VRNPSYAAFGSDRHLAAIRKYAAAGYDDLCIHQVGKDQKGFFPFYAEEILLSSRLWP
jgi:hypothetical protein